MKWKVLLLVVLGAILAFGWTFVKWPLSVPTDPVPPLPDAPRVAGVSVSVLPGAVMKSQQGFSVRGGSLTAPYRSGLAAFLVTHPRGRILIDAGVSRSIHEHLKTIPLLMQTVADLTLIEPTVDKLAAHGISPSDLRSILLTHSHWDHVSGLVELYEVPVWINAEELAFARSEHEPGGILFRQLEAELPLNVKELVLGDGEYGPFMRSRDVFGDRTVIAVPMPGHTPGQVAVLVNLPSGRRFLFIGDTSWAREGVDWPAEKPWITRRMVDMDAARVRKQLVLLHRLRRQHPELTIVPSHDARVHDAMAEFPAREN